MMIHRLGWACRAAPGHQGQGRRSATPGDRQAKKEVRATLGGDPSLSPIVLSRAGHLLTWEDVFLNQC